MMDDDWMMDDDLKASPIQRVGLVRGCRAFENQLIDSKGLSRSRLNNYIELMMMMMMMMDDDDDGDNDDDDDG